jgi:lauroyl/myristoyl acyltransferase
MNNAASQAFNPRTMEHGLKITTGLPRLPRPSRARGTAMPLPLPDAVHESGKVAALLLVSWLAPIEHLWPVAQALRRRKARPGGAVGATDIVMAHLLSDRVTPPQAAALFQRSQDRALEVTLQILALLRPGRRWRPAIRTHGFENLAAALAAGSGAILWISDFLYRPVIVPLALRQAGFRGPVHLSRPEHGFSVSPFAVRTLNPLWAAVENRYLGERVVIENNDAGAALQRLRDGLAGNDIVSITVAETGRRTMDAKFLRGTLRVATGPLHLARSTGAPLLPVFAVRNEQGIYDVTIGQALPVADDVEPLYAAAVRAYCAMLEPFVRDYPDQWNGWLALGRLVEAAPAFATSFEHPEAIAGALARRGLHPGIPAAAARA